MAPEITIKNLKQLYTNKQKSVKSQKICEPTNLLQHHFTVLIIKPVKLYSIVMNNESNLYQKYTLLNLTFSMPCLPGFYIPYQCEGIWNESSNKTDESAYSDKCLVCISQCLARQINSEIPAAINPEAFLASMLYSQLKSKIFLPKILLNF